MLKLKAALLKTSAFISALSSAAVSEATARWRQIAKTEPTAIFPHAQQPLACQSRFCVFKEFMIYLHSKVDLSKQLLQGVTALRH